MQIYRSWRTVSPAEPVSRRRRVARRDRAPSASSPSGVRPSDRPTRVDVDRFGQRERAREAAVAALDPVILLARACRPAARRRARRGSGCGIRRPESRCAGETAPEVRPSARTRARSRRGRPAASSQARRRRPAGRCCSCSARRSRSESHRVNATFRIVSSMHGSPRPYVLRFQGYTGADHGIIHSGDAAPQRACSSSSATTCSASSSCTI